MHQCWGSDPFWPVYNQTKTYEHDGIWFSSENAPNFYTFWKWICFYLTQNVGNNCCVLVYSSALKVHQYVLINNTNNYFRSVNGWMVAIPWIWPWRSRASQRPPHSGKRFNSNLSSSNDDIQNSRFRKVRFTHKVITFRGAKPCRLL